MIMIMIIIIIIITSIILYTMVLSFESVHEVHTNALVKLTLHDLYL